MIAQCAGRTFVHPAALFPPTAQELQARRHRGSLIVAEQPDSEDESNPTASGEDLDGMGAEEAGAEDDMPDGGAILPPVTTTAGQQPAT